VTSESFITQVSHLKVDKLVKSHFANDIEPFWKKIQNEPGVKNFKLFELAGRLMNPKMAHGESEIRLFTKSSKLIKISLHKGLDDIF